MKKLRLALCQMNATVGDLDGNADKIIQSIDEARRHGCDLITFPELALTGYPPEDLLLKPSFIRDNLKMLDHIVSHCHNITAIVGFVDAGDDIFNAAAVANNGRLAGVYHKRFLPNYGVFDEDRYFQAGDEYPVFQLGDAVFGVNICEDIWYPGLPTAAQAQAGAELILNINASPFHVGKAEERARMLATRAADYTVIVAYNNLVGGQDELVFDGSAMVFDQLGRLQAESDQFREQILYVDLDLERVFRARLHDPRIRKERRGFDPAAARVTKVILEPRSGERDAVRPATPFRPLSEAAQVYEALTLGTRDFVLKNGFNCAVVALSGGIDSSLVAAISVDALVADNVIGVSMPSRFSSTGSKDDARRLAENLGIRFITIPIEPAFQATLEMLADTFAGQAEGVAEENLQARIRGNIMMALSNKFNWLVLTAGNKSEMATGYATLYGDMAGAFAVIKDVSKTLVYELARYRNCRAGYDLIPDSVLTKEPSAELKPDQRDVDSLPPYDELDPILQAYVEHDRSLEEIVDQGHERTYAELAIELVDRSEHKRRQAPPGVKVTRRAFGRDRRLPITNRYRRA